MVLAEETRKQQTYEHMQNRARNGAEDASKELDLLHLEVAALGRDLFNLEIYLRDTRRLRAKSEDALNWMQENYNFRVSEANATLASASPPFCPGFGDAGRREQNSRSHGLARASETDETILSLLAFIPHRLFKHHPYRLLSS
jgi:hypothetical protein